MLEAWVKKPEVKKKLQQLEVKQQWYEPIFLHLRESGTRCRWFNDEVFLIPGSSDSIQWLRERMSVVEVVSLIYFNRSDVLNSKIIAAYGDKVQATLKNWPNNHELAHKLARNAYTLRGSDWDGKRNFDKIDEELTCWNRDFCNTK